MLSAIIELFPKLVNLYRRISLRVISSHTAVLFNQRFHDETSLMQLLSRQSTTDFPRSKFIDYSIVVRNNYYPGESISINTRIDGNISPMTFPYKEVINYRTSPRRIELAQKELTDQFQLSDRLLRETQNSFDTFVNERNVTTNDPSLRIKSLTQASDGTFTCQLQLATYYDQIRTNLTIDYLLDGLQEDTMRARDMGSGNTLVPFGKSILANTIGASAIWVMNQPASLKNRAKKYFYLLPRKNKTGIFNGMLGTVSGVVKAPTGNVFPTASLEEYVAGEIRREFYEETGIDILLNKGIIQESDIEVIPLAFVRDLIRGGKPQFFYLIATKYIRPRLLEYAFKHSYNGKEEFDADALTHIPTFRISAETHLNFLYALSYIQARRRLSFVDLDG